MLFKYLRVIYLNCLMIIFAYFNMPLFVIFVFLLKPCYLVWKLSFEQLSFFLVSNDVDDEWLMHIDYDTDSNFYFKLSKGEYYLWLNCYFFFDFNGGDAILNELDFLDIIIYNTFDPRNLKYIYKSASYKDNYNKDDFFFLHQFDNIYIKRYNLKRNVQFLNKDTYNILNNADNLQELSNRKKYYYKKKKC